MLWPGVLVPPLMEYCLRLISVWPEHKNTFLFPIYTLLSISSLVFQFWNSTIVYDDLDSLTVNIIDLILVFDIYMKITIFWKQRWYVKDVIGEMLSDWNNLKKPEETNIMNNYVQFSHRFFVITMISYHCTMFLFLTAAFRTYFFESVEKRLFPIQVTFPFSSKISPIYEIILFLQCILLLMMVIGYSVMDTSYVFMSLHAVTKLETLKLTLDRFMEEEFKSVDALAIKMLIKRHLDVILYTSKLEKIYSGIMFVYFVEVIIQLCFLGFTYLVYNGINTLLKTTLNLTALLIQFGTYCAIGEYLQTKSDSVAEAAYLLPWHDLKNSQSKSIMMFIQRAQKPLYITAGKLVVVSHFAFIDIIKVSASYLSVLRAIRV